MHFLLVVVVLHALLKRLPSIFCAAFWVLPSVLLGMCRSHLCTCLTLSPLCLFLLWGGPRLEGCLPFSCLLTQAPLMVDCSSLAWWRPGSQRLPLSGSLRPPASLHVLPPSYPRVFVLLVWCNPPSLRAASPVVAVCHRSPLWSCLGGELFWEFSRPRRVRHDLGINETGVVLPTIRTSLCSRCVTEVACLVGRGVCGAVAYSPWPCP